MQVIIADKFGKGRLILPRLLVDVKFNVLPCHILPYCWSILGFGSAQVASHARLLTKEKSLKKFSKMD